MGDEAYQKKGETDRDTGFRVGELFYLRSRLPKKRVMATDKKQMI